MGFHENFKFSLKLPAFKGAYFLIATKLFNLYLKISYFFNYHSNILDMANILRH